ncbi:MAG: phenylacetate--CoA ligase [Vicinamibacterales bacterium]
MSPMWNPACESMPRAQLERLQLSRLATQIARAGTLPVYRRRLEAAGLTQPDIRDLSEVPGLPLLTKDDLREAYPYGFCAAPREDLVRVHATSGTTGKLTVSPYTRADMDTWAELMARSLTATGVTRDDVVHNAYGYGLFTGGLGFDLGGQRVGCATIPISGGLTARQLMLIEDLRATVLTCTPSYALVLAEEAEAAGIDVRTRWALARGIFGAEPWTEAMRAEIESRLGLVAYDVYGLAEMIGPGVAIECSARDGLHVFEDHFLAELIDPVTERVLPPGSTGELVLTALSREALPLVRYRTRDRVTLTHEPCACGRTMARMSRVLGRTDDMLVVRGVNVFPSQIEDVLMRVAGLSAQYRIEVDRPRHRLDTLEVRVETSTDLPAREAAEALEREAARRLQASLGIGVRVTAVPPRSLERSQGKAVRVVDRRPS